MYKQKHKSSPKFPTKKVLITYQIGQNVKVLHFLTKNLKASYLHRNKNRNISK